jgi:hypothetical protein
MRTAEVSWWGTTILGISQRAFLDAKMSLEERKKKKEKRKDDAEAQRSQSQRREEKADSSLRSE